MMEKILRISQALPPSLLRTFTTTCYWCQEIERTEVVNDSLTEKDTLESTVRKRNMLIFAKGDKKFVDWKRVRIFAGNGGRGSASFVHSRDNKGGPNGGDGGNGGNVRIITNNSLTHLIHLKSQYKAQSGQPGGQKNRHGKNAEDLVLEVPLGTTIRNHISSRIICDLTHDVDRVTIARGGRGGLGNFHFKSAINVRPREFTEGESGEEVVVEIELKSIADVGLVGFPNAGKSTLLRCLSRARPKIANYPFTTLKPNIGVVQYDDGTAIRVADIPGLIEGAHVNKGLGHVFLRHIERCLCLLYVIDVSLPQPLHHFNVLKNELEMYKKDLSLLPALLIANKVDLIHHSTDVVAKLQDHVEIPVIAVSGMHNSNIPTLKTVMKGFFRTNEKIT